ncbi:uncharacterized protein LOC112090835 [Morus notabilis]|uniref:uncharacterized protein LOC112090835 n=1 Tax=Morus notabilis TaxID=981085 RepID=UPI000CED27C6|nr:uncharacterized protein LOC112090835 [Morus notabilis]
MTTTFLNKYFPHHKTNNLKRQILNFAQKENETLYQAWERFKDLLNLCPHHGYESWHLVSYFYDGLTIRERQFVEMMCNGDFLQKDPDEAIEYLNELAEKAHTWTGPSATESTSRSRPVGVYQLREEDSLKAQVEALTKQIEALKSKDSKGPNMVARTEAHEPCLVCGGMGHLAQDCHTLSEMRGLSDLLGKCRKIKVRKEHLTQLKINLSLLHVIKQVPAYAKVIKDLCTIKRKHHVKKTAFLTKQMSAVIEQKTPPKYKDPGCPTISCQIGTHEFGQALLDLGSSVNLMPYSIYSQLGLGEIKPTTVILQLADRSIKRPRGIVEDVLLQVDKFYYPVDFLVSDTQSVVNMESSIPIILGRPFLATANALINCRNGLMKISFGNMTLEDRGTKFGSPCFQELPTEGEKPKSSTKEALKVKLAQPPEGLKYAFLGNEGTFPVIISSKLDALQEQRLIDMLKERNSRIKVKMKVAHDKQSLRKNYLERVNQVEEIILDDSVYQP